MAAVQRWGNSLAVRIPKAFAEQARLEENTEVEIAIRDDAILIRPVSRKWKLETLLAGITARNRHREVDWGGAVGREVW